MRSIKSISGANANSKWKLDPHPCVVNGDWLVQASVKNGRRRRRGINKFYSDKSIYQFVLINSILKKINKTFYFFAQENLFEFCCSYLIILIIVNIYLHSLDLLQNFNQHAVTLSYLIRLINTFKAFVFPKYIPFSLTNSQQPGERVPRILDDSMHD